MTDSDRSDQDKSGHETKKMPEAVAIHYQDAITELRFLKQQEWRVTNYVLLVFVAIFAINKEIDPAKIWEIIALVVLTAVTAGLGVVFLMSLSSAARNVRKKLQAIYEDYFSDDEKCRLRIDPDQAHTSVGPAFGWLFIGIVILGSFIIFYFLVRSQFC